MNFARIAYLASAAALAVNAVPAFAADIINTGPATLSSSPSSDQFLQDGVSVFAFRFTVASTFNLTNVSAYARALSTPGNIEFSIANAISGQPGADLFGCNASATTARTSYGCTLSGTIAAGTYFLKIGSDVGSALVVEGDRSVTSFVKTVTTNGYEPSNSPANLLLQGTLAATGVPEPATWAMMIVGFGLVGGTMRRRQRATVRFA